ncbi:hypothetical protein ACFSZT_24340 [Prauserella oleivorans]|uniref:hypothetical protein n=1 Tax=Prauserella oleivorans TaxID=1478153 RepID=UPI0036225FDC
METAPVRRRLRPTSSPRCGPGAAAGFAVGAATRWIGDGTVGVLARLAHTEPGDDAAAIR